MVVLLLGCRFCRLSVNTISGHIIIRLSLLSSISKHNMWSYYDWIVVVVVSKHNMWSYYDWVYCLPSVNTICGRIMIGLSLLSSVSKHNMCSYYVSVYCLPSVNTICGCIMIGFIVVVVCQ